MKLAHIYQTNAPGIMFLGYEQVMKQRDEFPLSSYEEVYSEEIADDAKLDLEELFMRFNVAKPKNYFGRSLSVSDVVLIEDDVSEEDSSMYYCDIFGWKEIEMPAGEEMFPAPMVASKTIIALIHGRMCDNEKARTEAVRQNDWETVAARALANRELEFLLEDLAAQTGQSAFTKKVIRKQEERK